MKVMAKLVTAKCKARLFCQKPGDLKVTPTVDALLTKAKDKIKGKVDEVLEAAKVGSAAMVEGAWNMISSSIACATNCANLTGSLS